MKKAVFLAIIALIGWGCATFSASYKSGTKAALNKDWDKAILYYERAIREDPDNPIYKTSLRRAQVAASYFHLNKARELGSRQKIEEARSEYEKALSYGVLNKSVEDEAEALGKEKTKEEIVREVRIEPPVKLKVDKQKIELKFPVQAPLKSIFEALGKQARINILFDNQFRDIPNFTFNLADVTFEEALSHLCLSSNNFYSIVDEKTVMIAPDLPQKRAQYDLNVIKTFYLSNVNADEVRAALQQMLRSQYRQPQVTVDKNLNSITIRDVPAVVELAEKILRSWDKARGEVYIDLEIMEVSRIKARQIGVDLALATQTVGLKYIGPTAPSDSWFNLKDLDFSKKEYFQVTLPTAYLDFLESDSDTKIIAQPQLRGIDGEDISYLVGDKVPVPQTTFYPIAAGGQSQQPLVSYNYQDVGIDVKIKPRIHSEKEVTLEMEIKIKSLSGTGVASIPIISTREVKNIIRLKDGETNLLAGLLRDEERKTKTGIVALKDIPILGGLFSSTDQAIQQTDVILTITPHIVRSITLGEQDLKPIWIGPEGMSTGERVSEAVSEEALAERRARQRQEQEETPRREERGQNRIGLTPSNITVAQNQEFRVNINLATQEEISSLSLSISFDSRLAKLKEVTKGGLLAQLGEEAPFLSSIDNSSSSCTIGFTSPATGRGIRGAGVLATLIFEAQEKGEGQISVTDSTASSPSGKLLAFESTTSRLNVR
jgi:general secretion pathway protein D